MGEDSQLGYTRPYRLLSAGDVRFVGEPVAMVIAESRYIAEDAVEIADSDGKVFAKGLVRAGSDVLASIAGRRTADLPEGVPHEVVHRDDLVVLPR